MIRLLLTATLIVCGFLYGVAVGRFQWPPFGLLAQIRKHVAVSPAFAQGSAYRAERLRGFRQEAGTFDVIMMGDSITEAGQWSALLPCFDIANRGIAWDTSADVLDRIAEVIQRKPKLVLLQIGINDLMRGLSPATVRSNVNAAVALFSRADIRVVLQSALFATADFWAPLNAEVTSLNEGLRSVANDHTIDFVDLNAVLGDGAALRKHLSTDGLHLNAAAYALWAASIEPYLARYASCGGSGRR